MATRAGAIYKSLGLEKAVGFVIDKAAQARET
jgi:hypothetical protein